MTKKEKTDSAIKIISQNKKARFDYFIIEAFEAGIVLTGAEIKSIRSNGITLNESYIRPEGNEIFLLNAHIKPYAFSGQQDFDPIRKRKLLLHAREIDKLRGRVEQKGLTIVALSLYLKKGRAKLEIGLARGKDAPDKRRSMKERESKREVERALKRGK